MYQKNNYNEDNSSDSEPEMHKIKKDKTKPNE